MINTFKLSFTAKIIAATFLSFQAQSLYAAPVITQDNCGDGCMRQITKDTETKILNVIVSSEDKNRVYDSDIYSYNDNQFEHFEITNSAHITKTPFYLFYPSKNNNSINAKSLKVENNGWLEGKSNEFGSNPEFGSVSERFELKNTGTIKLNGGLYGAIPIIGSNETEYYIENTGEMNLAGGSTGLSLANGKSARIYNGKTGVIRSGGYALNISGIENVIIENEGIIDGNIFRAEDSTGTGSLHIKSTGGKISGDVELYSSSNNTVELENTDVSNLIKIFVREAGQPTTNNTVKINQEMRIATGIPSVLPEYYTNIESIDKIVVGEKGKAILVDQIQKRSAPVEAQGVNAELLTNNGIIALAPESRSVDVKFDLTENNGIIDLNDGSNEPAQTLTLYGNYIGGEGSVLRVDHKWSNATEEENDLLIIKGKASGTTRVEVRDVSVGDAIRSDAQKHGGWSKPLVIVEQGSDGKTVFTGMVETQSAEQAHIAQRVTEDGVVYAWVLKYAPTVSGYTQTGFINQEMGLEQLGRLHERVGEQQENADYAEPHLNSWGRTRIIEGVLQGKTRFGVDSRRGLIQAGQDIALKQYASGYAHQGLILGYSWANNQFYDRDPLQNMGDASGELVGKGKTSLFSLGAYHTYYDKDNRYLDLLANVSWLENKYISQQSANQKGLGAGLSIEVGRSYGLNPQWRIEPQAQLKVHYVALGRIDDGIRKVERSNHFTVQGRLGVRLTDGTLYATANLLQDLTPAKAVSKIGQSRVEERYNATRFDVSLGTNIALNTAKTLTLYGELNYSRALGVSNRVFSHRNGRENYSAQIGIRFQW